MESTVAQEVMTTVVDSAMGLSRMNGEEVSLDTSGLPPDEEKKVLESAIRDLVEMVADQSEDGGKRGSESPINYRWTQTQETVQINIPIEDGVRARDVEVDLNTNSGTLCVSVRGKGAVLNGQLSGIVSSAGMTWQIDSDSKQRAVTVDLEKGSYGKWSSLLIGGPSEADSQNDTEDSRQPPQKVTAEPPTKEQDVSMNISVQQAEEEIIELNTRDMKRADDYNDFDNNLKADLMDALEEELEQELKASFEDGGFQDDDDRLATDASMRPGDLPLQELLDYYKAIALGETTGSETPEMAAMQVALFYSRGIVVKQDFSEAAKWYEMAAENGSDMAMFHLGLLLQEGLGVPVDVAKAIDWWRKAADMGNANAMYNLGVMYLNGREVPQNPGKAIEYFGRAKELDPSLPLPPFEELTEAAGLKTPEKPLTAEELAHQRENAIENLRYAFWTTTALTVAAVTFFSFRYWWKNRL